VKDIGLVGRPFSGKSTLFIALTRTGGHGGQANHAIVPVPDPRVEVLTDIERSAKTVHAQVGFVDVPGGTSSAQGIAKLRESDALAIVVRCFGPDADPASEVSEVRADLLLADQAVIEPALEKAEKKQRKKLREIDQAIEGDVVRHRREPVFGRLGLALRPLDQQPLLRSRIGALIIAMGDANAQTRKARGERLG